MFKIQWGTPFFNRPVTKKISQLQLLRVIKALQNINNKTLAEEFIEYIEMVDKVEGEEKGEKIKTDFERKPPRNINATVFREW